MIRQDRTVTRSDRTGRSCDNNNYPSNSVSGICDLRADDKLACGQT